MKSGYRQLGEFIRQVDVRNKNLEIDNLLGVSIEKRFIPSIANTVGTDFSSYKIVRRGQFAYGPVTSRNGNKISIAYLNDEDAIISSSYTVFEVTECDVIDPEYLMLWFSRPEFDRYARFKSHGSVREIFDWDEMCKVELPVPDIEEQKKIVHAYKVIEDRINLKKRINQNLESAIQNIFQNIFSVANISVSDTVIKNTSVPIGWVDTTVDSVAKLQTGPFGTQLHSDEYVLEGNPVINVKNIGYGSIIMQNMDYLDDETSNRLSAHRLEFGDIVFGRKGSIDRHAFINNYCIGWIQGSDCIRIRPYDNRVGLFLYCWFGQNFIKQLVVSSSVGSTMASLNTKILGSIRVILPPERMLDEFYQHTASIMTVMEKNHAETHKLAILQEMMLVTLANR
ncbi:MAG: restriction endonuclease subunit S [Methanocorpusculum sp.]|jgi:type I restriction enzyme S subunit|nr:restriction endonuclease subunit S [Methanocorpusculum sp.]HJJ73793.1 restriction endonuclease subunit S [Methanocorpusculum sp.]